MNWKYNITPNTGREVLVAFRAPNEYFPEWENHVKYTMSSYDPVHGWSIPDHWELVAWSDFDRLKVDAEGKATEHNRLDVEGIAL